MPLKHSEPIQNTIFLHDLQNHTSPIRIFAFLAFRMIRVTGSGKRAYLNAPYRLALIASHPNNKAIKSKADFMSVAR
jgi:hypothetical protein